jgi:hypothetical protein
MLLSLMRNALAPVKRCLNTPTALTTTSPTPVEQTGMRKRGWFTKLAKVGLCLLILNEIRGIIFVALFLKGVVTL